MADVNTFTYTQPNEENQAKISTIREQFTALETTLKDKCPEGRRRSLAMTELENACMWAIKAIAHG